MSEVALVAAITGGSAVLTSGITAAVTWAVSRRSSAVDLAKLKAESDRVQQGNREEERRNRQSTYHQFLDALVLIFQILGQEVSEEKRAEICDEYNHLFAGVILFGPPSVRHAAYDLNDVYSRIWPALEREFAENPEKPPPQCWRDATSGLSDDFSARTSELVRMMHLDVTRGVVEDPEPDRPLGS